jgi:hypothetical protein
MQKYRQALHAMVQQKGDGKLGGVTWEVSRSAGIHIHWQFLPVPAETIRSGLVEAAFKVAAENEHYPKIEQREIGDGTGERSDYFRFWIWSPPGPSDSATTPTQPQESKEGMEKAFILPLSANFRFDLQFGRMVLAKLLRLDSRANWKDATQTQAEEEADAQAFKAAFKEFDFSIED